MFDDTGARNGGLKIFKIIEKERDEPNIWCCFPIKVFPNLEADKKLRQWSSFMGPKEQKLDIGVCEGVKDLVNNQTSVGTPKGLQTWSKTEQNQPLQRLKL